MWLLIWSLMLLRDHFRKIMAVSGMQDQISPHKSDLKRSRLPTKREIPYVINRMQSGHYRKYRQKSQNFISYIWHSLKIEMPKPHIFLQQHKPCEKKWVFEIYMVIKEAKQKTISSKNSKKFIIKLNQVTVNFA